MPCAGGKTKTPLRPFGPTKISPLRGSWEIFTTEERKSDVRNLSYIRYCFHNYTCKPGHFEWFSTIEDATAAQRGEQILRLKILSRSCGILHSRKGLDIRSFVAHSTWPRSSTSNITIVYIRKSGHFEWFSTLEDATAAQRGEQILRLKIELSEARALSLTEGK